ncbi:unnamed protein product [Mytilus edulis]|uniref:Uncharacterized protein n=1 Tax=Mytilus edulis TaxID=6550 RepID=A0A8S3TH83_MYTED|nr:unnamed protein product [Mytilus edulis]
MALKAKEVRVEISLNKKIMISKNYEKTRCNWPRILENIRSNIDELPGQAKSLYQEGDFQKLRRRMSDQMKKLTKEGAIITNEELKEIVERIREMESRYSGQAGDHPKDKVISKKLCKRGHSGVPVAQKEIEKEIEAVVKRRMLDDDHREGAIEVPAENPSSSEEDEPVLVQAPPSGQGEHRTRKNIGIKDGQMHGQVFIHVIFEK